MPEITIEELLNIPTTVHKAPDVTPKIMAEYLEANGYEKVYTISRESDGPLWDVYGKAKEPATHCGLKVPLRSDYYADWVSRVLNFMQDCAFYLKKTELRVWYEMTTLARK